MSFWKLTRESAGKLANRLLELLIFDIGEVAQDLKKLAWMARRGLRRFLADSIIKVRERRAQDTGDLVQPAGGNAVRAALVLLYLVAGHADPLGELLPRQTEHDAAFADARADKFIDLFG